jgi:hypothetical protein
MQSKKIRSRKLATEAVYFEQVFEEFFEIFLVIFPMKNSAELVVNEGNKTQRKRLLTKFERISEREI